MTSPPYTSTIPAVSATAFRLLGLHSASSARYAFAIGSYIIDRNGKLSGEKNEELTEALAAQGFTAA